ncbi:MAG: hypothetical protein J6I36_04030 [Bacteroidaceae bacterium]|jgi:hypothetical protein|nr:hypothetical protein [Bacteroidaceae bacterium]MBR0244347.1 hypothetical protein [Bacteroidaceae bacterium]
MSFFSKLFGRKTAETETKVGGMEDFMTLIRVYLQASIAAQVGISNLAVLPDLRVFKQTLKVPTVNNKLGVGEKKRCAKMLNEIYHVSETFPTEIDTSVKKRCKKLQDVQPYMLQFQGFSQDLMMVMGNLMQWKFRLPAFMRSALKTMTEKTVHDLLTKNDWKDENVRRTVAQIRLYQEKLGFSESWMSEYVYTTVMLAKKEKRPNIEEDK